MRKKLSIILALILLCSFSSVYADMEVPEVKPYEAVVSNPEGASYFDSISQESGVLEYGTKVKVEYEDYYSPDGVTYASCFIEGNAQEHFEIKVSDLRIAGNAEEHLTDLTNSKNAFLVSKKQSIVMKKGPAEVYQNYSVQIPAFSEITVFNYSYQDAWAYVSYQNQEGWIKTIDVQILFSPKYKEIILLEDTTWTEYRNTKHQETIAKGEKIQDYYEVEPGTQLFIKKDGELGTISTENAVVEESGTIEITMNYCNIYETINPFQESDASHILFANVAIGTKLSYQYHNPFLDTYFVEFNGIKGWVYGYQNKVVIKGQVNTSNSNSQEKSNSSVLKKEDTAKNVSKDVDEFAEQNDIISKLVIVCVALFGLFLLIRFLNRKE